MAKKDFFRKVEKAKEIGRKKSLKYSIKDANAYSIMYGFGESYITPFALALKATASQIAFLTSFPRLASSIAQMLAAKVTDKFKTRKKITLVSVFLQALIWLPMLLIPFIIERHNILLLTILFSLYWVFGQFAEPAWSSWMGDLVKDKERGIYFGKRNKIAGFVSFVSTFVAGIILYIFSGFDVFVGFAILFAVALVARLVSLYYLNKMYEPPYTVQKGDYFSFGEYIKRLPKTNYGKFAIYFSLLTLSTQVAAPFFSVFMLRDLHFNYLTYTILISASGISTFMSMVYWGKNADEFGNKKVMTICGLIVSTIPLFWLVSYSPIYLVFVQILSGFAWAGFNLAAFNFLFDTVSPSKRTRCVAFQNVLLGTSIFIGATFGGYLTKVLVTPTFFVSNIEVVFIISGVLRLAASIALLPKIKEEKPVRDVETEHLFWNLVAVKPIRSMRYQVVRGTTKTIDMIKDGADALKGKKF